MKGFLVVRKNNRSVVAVIAETKNQALIMATNTDKIKEDSDVYELIVEDPKAPFSAEVLDMNLPKNQKYVKLVMKREEIKQKISDTDRDIAINQMENL